MQERLQKFLSHAGVASRRKSEELILSGAVLVNGKKVTLGQKVDSKKDVVTFYGKKILAEEEKIYLILNKPKGYLTSRSDLGGRKTVYDLLPKNLQKKVWYVGRLDYNTEGLLIFTNDGELTQQLTHPKFEHEKEYEVLYKGKVEKGKIEKLRKGVKISTGKTNPAKVVQKQKKLFITIHEGMNRQVRKMCEVVGVGIVNLKRVRVGRLKLPSSLKRGKFLYIAKDDIILKTIVK